MKKTLIIMAGILLAVFVVLTLADRGEYGLEKRLWRVQKQFNKAAKDPKAVPAQKYDNIISQYELLIKRYPKTSLTPKIHIQVGMTYMLKQDFEKARQTFKNIIALYPQDEALGAIALMNVGSTYESENNGEKAIEVYEQVMKQYASTTIGLNMPIYIANYYLKLNNRIEATSALNRAVLYYQKIAQENPGSALGFNALRLQVTAHYAQQEWRKAVQVLGRLLLDYANSNYLNPERAQLFLKSINTISVVKLQDFQLPLTIYQQFIDKNPQHPLNKYIQEMISAIKKFEKDGIQVETKKPQ